MTQPIPTGLGCIRNVVRFSQLPNLSHISLQVSITSNKLCLKPNSLVQLLSVLSLLLLSDSLLYISLLSNTLLSISFLLPYSTLLSSLSLLLLPNSSILLVSTQPALLAYPLFLLLRVNFELLSDSGSLACLTSNLGCFRRP